MRLPEPSWMAGPDCDDYASWQMQLRCDCGAWLPTKPVSYKDFENSEVCDGEARRVQVENDDWAMYAKCGPCDGPHEPHKIIYDAGTVALYNCKRCGTRGIERGY
tara:strand:- start:48 stop:362 length:315 start_codon:yes stop_codon:yes gene_type:complete